jgi:hypothetical protein
VACEAAAKAALAAAGARSAAKTSGISGAKTAGEKRGKIIKNGARNAKAAEKMYHAVNQARGLNEAKIS